MDLALYDLQGTYSVGIINDIGYISEATSYTTSDAKTASTTAETIAGKVLKFLFTYKGTDAFEPNYGGTALHWKNISDQTLLQFKAELQDDITNCLDYIKGKELSLDSTDERLYTIKVLDVDYSRSEDPTKIVIHIAIITTYGNIVAVRMNTAE